MARNARLYVPKSLSLTKYSDLTVYATVYYLPLESRPHSSYQKNEYLPHLREIKKLLPMLHA